MKESELKFRIKLDENNIPEEIKWDSEENNAKDNKVDALFVSLWDSEIKETLKIDLWTKNMLLDDMKRFYYHIFKSLSEKYVTATNDKEMGNHMEDFAEFFKKEIDV